MREPPGSGSAPRRSPPRRPPGLFPRPRCTSPLRPPVCARWACPKKSSAHSPLSSSPALPVTRAVRGVSETSAPTHLRTGSGAWTAPSRTFSSRSSRRRGRSTRLHRRCAAGRGTGHLRRSLASIRRISAASSRSALPTASASRPSTGSACERRAATSRAMGTWSRSASFCSAIQTSTTAIRNALAGRPGGAATCSRRQRKTPAARRRPKRHLPRASRSAAGRSRFLVVRAIRRTRERFRRTAAQRRSSGTGGGGVRSRVSKSDARRTARTTLPTRAIRRDVVCPFGAHIRRANPRTGDFPAVPSGPFGTDRRDARFR